MGSEPEPSIVRLTWLRLVKPGLSEMPPPPLTLSEDCMLGANVVSPDRSIVLATPLPSIPWDWNCVMPAVIAGTLRNCTRPPESD